MNHQINAIFKLTLVKYCAKGFYENAQHFSSTAVPAYYLAWNCPVETNPFIPVTKKRFISPKPRLISPVFEHICLKLGEKASQRTLLFLAFDGFTFRYAADLVLNSTVSSQIVHLFHNLYIRQLVLCRIYFKTSKGRADVALSKNLRF